MIIFENEIELKIIVFKESLTKNMFNKEGYTLIFNLTRNTFHK